MSDNLPGMVNPCGPFAPFSPYHGMEPFYLGRIQTLIREAESKASMAYSREMEAMRRDGLEPYPNGKDAALAPPRPGSGLYLAIERDSQYGYIRSHSRVGDLASVQRFAAIQYTCARDSREGRGGYDVIISAYSLAKHLEFSLSPGRECPCERCDDKRAIKAERPLRLRRAALEADLLAARAAYETSMQADAAPLLDADGLPPMGFPMSERTMTLGESENAIARSLTALRRELETSKRARDAATAESKRAADAEYQAERKRNPSGLDILRAEFRLSERDALDLDERLRKAYR